VSPLHYFKAFRYHPKYRETVHGGLKSVTYSNHINPKQALCPDELDGRVCPRGAACEFQHFKSMTVPGEWFASPPWRLTNASRHWLAYSPLG
jgi:hypothetical protein